MAFLNYEFKAHTSHLKEQETKLLTQQPLFKGEDHQSDTYFNVPKGRLKLREGNIENALIYYERENTSGGKQSHILLYKHQPDAMLKEILTTTNGIKVVVKKSRRIYFIDNIKFHFDTVDKLGTFIEVEAIDIDGSIGIEKLKEQCEKFAAFFSIQQKDYIAVSYSDMLIDKIILKRSDLSIQNKKIMKTIIFSALIACIAFTSCSPANTPAIGTTTTDNNVALLEGTWELNYISGPRIAFEGLYPDKKPTLVIDLSNKKISGNTGCNSYTGPLVAGSGDIDFNQPIAVTRMACGGNGLLGETTYLEILKKIKKYSVTDGKTLNLISGDIALMRFTKK